MNIRIKNKIIRQSVSKMKKEWFKWLCDFWLTSANQRSRIKMNRFGPNPCLTVNQSMFSLRPRRGWFGEKFVIWFPIKELTVSPILILLIVEALEWGMWRVFSPFSDLGQDQPKPTTILDWYYVKEIWKNYT